MRGRLQQKVYNNTTLGKTTDYIGEFVFENGSLDYLLHEEGRVAYESGSYRYEYFIKDHLGNVRQVIRAPETSGFTATMETSAAEEEEMRFEQLPESRQSGVEHNSLSAVADHPRRGPGGLAERRPWPGAGPCPYPGSAGRGSVKLAVHGKYRDRQKDKVNPGSFISSGAKERLLTDLGEFSRVSMRSGAPNAITVFNMIDLLMKDLQKKEVPEAYMMYALYDSDSVLYKTGKQVLSKNAANQHEILEEDIYISEDGYIETFLVNETEEDVWYDNFSVQSTTALIVQETHYDPWGLELTGLGYQYGGIKVNKYLYNGKEILKDHNLGLYDYGARFYDPAIGRWSSVDPLADHQKQIGMSPYSAFWNNPIRYNDPDGRCPSCDDDMSNVVATEIFNVKHSLYNLFARPFGYEATFVKNERGNYETGFVETSDGFLTGALNYGLDALNVVTFGRGGGVTGGFIAKSGASTPVINGSKDLLKANKEAGKVGEDFLNNAFGGTPQVSIGIGKERRVIDNFTESGVAQESKVGRTSLTKTVQTQISKDVKLINDELSGVRVSEWHFFPGKSGIGPTKPLQNELNRVKIPFVIHD